MLADPLSAPKPGESVMTYRYYIYFIKLGS